PDFTRYLKESIDDPRLVPVTGSAADVAQVLDDRGLGSADYVLSGLPFSTLPPGVGEAIADATARVIRPRGAFLVYQFSPKVRERPFGAAPRVGPFPVDRRRDPSSVLRFAIEIGAERRGKAGVLDPQHRLRVDVEAAVIEVRRGDVDDAVDDSELGVELRRFI